MPTAAQKRLAASEAVSSKDPKAVEKQLAIQVRSLERLAKEHKHYLLEVKENEAKLNEMKVLDKDPYDIKKFEEVLGESYMMVPDSKKRFLKSLENLKSFVESNAVILDSDNEWIVKARAILREHSLETTNTDVQPDRLEATNVEDLMEGEEF